MKRPRFIEQGTEFSTHDISFLQFKLGKLKRYISKLKKSIENIETNKKMVSQCKQKQEELQECELEYNKMLKFGHDLCHNSGDDEYTYTILYY